MSSDEAQEENNEAMNICSPTEVPRYFIERKRSIDGAGRSDSPLDANDSKQTNALRGN